MSDDSRDELNPLNIAAYDKELWYAGNTGYAASLTTSETLVSVCAKRVATMEKELRRWEQVFESLKAGNLRAVTMEEIRVLVGDGALVGQRSL
jgi:hypothetical protein